MFALLLKLPISTSPAAIAPPLGKPSGTNATPYGLRSPFAGIVEELICAGMNACCAAATDPGADASRVAASATPLGRMFDSFLVCIIVPLHELLERAPKTTPVWRKWRESSAGFCRCRGNRKSPRVGSAVLYCGGD